MARPGTTLSQAGNSLCDVLEQLVRFDPQRVRDRDDVQKAHIAFPALDAADVRAMQPTFLCQRLLRHLALFPGLADRLPKNGAGIGSGHMATIPS